MGFVLQEKLFLTDDTLRQQLDHLDNETADSVQSKDCEQPDLQVTSMDSDHVVIQIKVR